MVSKINPRKGRYYVFALFVIFSIAVERCASHVLSDDPEIALTLDEPWEDMRQRSSAVISPAIPNEIWFRMPKSDARLRFIDPIYGFETPLARFLTIGFINRANGVSKPYIGSINRKRASDFGIRNQISLGIAGLITALER